MRDFPAADLAPAQLCVERVRSCEVCVGLLGTRYGSPVRNRPKVNRPGFGGGIDPTEGWSHVSTEEVSA
jgi:Domain of unknown function (DUF4062)